MQVLPHPLGLALSLALAAPLPAQAQVVIPAAQAKAEGNGFEALPFAYNRVHLAQHIGASLLKGQIPAKSTITAIAYRRDGTVFPGRTLVRTLNNVADPTWTIRMGNHVGNARHPLPFHTRPFGGRGRGPIVSTVFGSKKVKFPSLGHSKG